MTGWIKLHRKLLNWEWYDDLPTFRLFTHLLLSVNYEQKRWRGIDIMPGQIVTGRKVLSEQTGISEMQVRTSLTKLKSTNEITIKTHNKFSVITIVSWLDYQQDNQQINQQITNKQPTNNQQITTTKERKNIRSKENNISKLSLTEREEIFKHDVASYTSKYPKELLREFYDYWTEPTRNKQKMRFELEKTWDTARRIANWARRAQKSQKPPPQAVQKPAYPNIPRYTPEENNMMRQIEKTANLKVLQV